MPASDVATVLQSATARAGAIEQANQRTEAGGGPAGEASGFDVWTHTGKGLSARAEAGAEGAPARGVAEGLTGDWASADAGAVGGSVSEQAAQAWSQFQLLTGQREPAAGESAPQGALGGIGATFEILTGLEQMISAPLAMIPFPAFPAIRVMDMDIGLPHAHNHPPNLVPPAPPVPLPSTGPIIPIPFLSGATRTLINGMPAARCGDMGLGIWCGGYFPMYEVFMGSSSVWIEGQRAGRILVDVTRHCMFSTPRPSDPPMGPMVGTTVSSSVNVLIGGVPMPSLLDMAMGAAIQGLFSGMGRMVQALRRSRRGGQRAGRAAAPHSRAPNSSSTPMSVQKNIGDGMDDLRGKPYDFFYPQLTERANDFLDQLRVPGDRMVLADGITASELAAMTRASSVEWAVAVGPDGKAYLIRGHPRLVEIPPGYQGVVHTHPDNYKSCITAISEADAEFALYQSESHSFGWDHPQAVVDVDGNVHAFDKNGVVERPMVSPIGRDGNIDGIHRSPTGAPIHAIPDAMVPTAPGV